MGTKKLDLDMDYIGGQGALTKVEERELSDYFKKLKLNSKQISSKKRLRLSKKLKAST